VAIVNLVPPLWWDDWWVKYHPSPNYDPFNNIDFYLAGIWILLFGISLVFYGKRGLWLLIGMPFAFFWIGMLLLWINGFIG